MVLDSRTAIILFDHKIFTLSRGSVNKKMLLLVYLLAGLSVQLLLALFTAKDAHSRGQDRDIWFISVLIFGILAIIIYLLTRNDREVPESDRKSKKTVTRLLYIGSALSGFIILGIISSEINPYLFPPPPLVESCGGYTGLTFSTSPDPNNACEVLPSRRPELRAYRDTREGFQTLASLAGLIIGFFAFYFYRNNSKN